MHRPASRLDRLADYISALGELSRCELQSGSVPLTREADRCGVRGRVPG